MYKCWSYSSQWKDWRQGEERFSDAPKSVENNKDFRKKKNEERKKEKTLKTERTCLITYIS